MNRDQKIVADEQIQKQNGNSDKPCDCRTGNYFIIKRSIFNIRRL